MCHQIHTGTRAESEKKELKTSSKTIQNQNSNKPLLPYETQKRAVNIISSLEKIYSP